MEILQILLLTQEVVDKFMWTFLEKWDDSFATKLFDFAADTEHGRGLRILKWIFATGGSGQL